jgi:two-component system LytT family response regulator
MFFHGKIKTVIIGNDENNLLTLKKHLSDFPSVEVLASVTNYQQALNLLVKEKFDLVFTDIELSGKSGLELIREVRTASDHIFSAIICSKDDKHAIQALRESATDYIVKPIKPNDLKDAIERYKNKRLKNDHTSKVSQIYTRLSKTESVSLPTLFGLKFVEKKGVALFICSKESPKGKPGWTALLSDQNRIKLKPGITAKNIIEFMGGNKFVQLNQSTVISLYFISHIEFSTRECFMLPPFTQTVLKVSKSHLSEIKGKYDRL